MAARAMMLALMCLGAVAGVEYVILIDAGSSGSRIHVHPYEDGDVPQIEASMTVKQKPGLSSFEKNPADAGASLTPLIEFAKKSLDQSRWAETPIHLQATAGLRSIPADAAEKILESCRATLKASPFKFEPQWARIISGTQEGVNGWLALNYLQGVFANGSTERSTGIVEMGGASIQITFEPSPEAIADAQPDQLTTVDLGKIGKYKVYTHSYLNYGLEAAQHLAHSEHLAVSSSAPSGGAGSPCYSRDYSNPALGIMKAVGSYASCDALVRRIIRKTKCLFSSCGFDGIYQPKIFPENRFYAIENFYYTTQFFQLESDSAPFARLKDKGSSVCSADWTSLKQLHPKEPESDLAKYCFSAAYLPAILEQGFGFTEPSKNVVVARKVKGIDIDWALGAVFYLLARRGLPEQAIEDKGSHPLPFPAITFGWLCAAVALGVVLFVVARRKGDFALLRGKATTSLGRSPTRTDQWP